MSGAGDLKMFRLWLRRAKTYDDIGLAFQDLSNGQITAVVCDSPVTLPVVRGNRDYLKWLDKEVDQGYAWC